MNYGTQIFNSIIVTILGERYEYKQIISSVWSFSTAHSYPSWIRIFALGSCPQILLLYVSLWRKTILTAVPAGTFIFLFFLGLNSLPLEDLQTRFLWLGKYSGPHIETRTHLACLPWPISAKCMGLIRRQHRTGQVQWTTHSPCLPWNNSPLDETHSVVLYGCEIWSFTLREERFLIKTF